MNCIKAENNVYLFETEDRYEVQNQNPKEGTQYSRFAEGYEEAVKIYNEEVLENKESNMDKAEGKQYWYVTNNDGDTCGHQHRYPETAHDCIRKMVALDPCAWHNAHVVSNIEC